jgi:outer membrane receptor protein involved in Fe transport
MQLSRFFIYLMLLTFCNKALAQTINGRVTDADGNGLIALLSANNTQVYSSANGDFSIKLSTQSTEDVILVCTKVGYNTQEKIVSIKNTQNIQFVLVPKFNGLEAVTISGSRYKKRTAEEIVSISILKPDFVRNAAINRTDEALNKLPGVDVVENQINIRGGSGWSYGAGSRVMVLVDDMPMLTADASDAKWDYLPLESVGQIEVLKGAASAIYGSSALNGAVNFRTAFAKNKPTTKLQLFGGLYGNPNREEMAWWGNKQPSFTGGYLSHSQKVGNTDIVAGGAWYYEDSYLQGDLSRRGRANVHIRHKLKKNPYITIGLSANFQKGRSQTFFLHVPDTTFKNLLTPYGGLADSTTTINKNRGTRFNIDPYLIWVGKKGITHNLRTRAFLSQNLIPEKNQTSIALLLYGEYQVVRKWQDTTGFFKDLNAIAGIAASNGDVQGELYGDRVSYNIAPYLQLEKKLGRAWLAAGARYEVNSMNRQTAESKPVFRTGINYEAGKHTFLRASWGQGYRFPTIAERFIKTSFGAASVFPNPGLQSETGHSKEIGIKQGVKLGKWLGVVDAALFNMRYNNMIEFNFTYVYPTEPGSDSSFLKNLGFVSQNIGSTSITGTDISLQATKQAKSTQNLLLGYTYILPIQLGMDSAIAANYSGDRNFLKYRYQHSLKAAYQWSYKKWSLGTINTITSPMVNIDEVFENSKPNQNIYGLFFQIGTQLPSTIKKYRDTYNTWVWISDAQIAYQLHKKLRIALVIKNLRNQEYYNRPALIGAPRNYTLQLFADI